MFPRYIILSALFLLVCPSLSQAVWIWTPQTGKFINPKFAVKATPADQLDYAKSFLQGKKYAQATSEFKKLLRHYPRAKEAPEAQYYLGQILEDLGKPYAAYKAYQMVIDKYPFSDRATEIVGLEYQIADQMLEGKDRRGKWVDVVLGDEDQVIEIFHSVIKDAPYGQYAAISQYKIGLYLKERGLYQEARDAFEKTLDDYPSSEWAKAARFQIAMADTSRASNPQHEQKITAVALEEFKEFVENHPDSELTPEAKKQIDTLKDKEAEHDFVIAQFYDKQKNSKAAGVYYKSLIEKYPDSSWATKAQQRLKAIGE